MAIRTIGTVIAAHPDVYSTTSDRRPAAAAVRPSADIPAASARSLAELPGHDGAVGRHHGRRAFDRQSDRAP
jgi:hypothetical protein